MRRHVMTEHCYPDKFDAHEFVEDVREMLVPFLENMKSLGIDKNKELPEEWFEIFGRWSELQSEGWNVFKQDEEA